MFGPKNKTKDKTQNDLNKLLEKAKLINLTEIKENQIVTINRLMDLMNPIKSKVDSLQIRYSK